MSGWDGSLTPAVNGVGEEVEKEEGERRGEETAGRMPSQAWHLWAGCWR